jgi:hypothetical protein
MHEHFEVRINARRVAVPYGCNAAAALIIAGAWRRSVQGEARAPVCGMGICFECCAKVNGAQHVRTCQVTCEPGMTIDTE